MPIAPKLISQIASWLILAGVAVAPWIGGARTQAPGVLWILGGLFCVAFLLVCVERARESRRPQVPRGAAWGAGVLIACLGWWLAQPEPDFVSAFAAEHWRFLENWNPAGQLQFPRLERLFIIGSALLGFLAAADLGRNEEFRHRVLWTLSASGMAVALYSVAQRWLGWPPPPWLFTSRGLDECSSTYFNYSAAAASLNLAWPWLVFGAWKATRKTRGVVTTLTLIATASALTVWPATSGWGVAGILLTAGALWRFPAPSHFRNARWVLMAVSLLFAAAFLWQGKELVQLRARYSDNWMGVESTSMAMGTRDAWLRTASIQRSDRLVSSPAPALPSVWTAALRMAADHPLLGNGPGSWVRESPLYSNDPLVNTFFHMRQFAHHDLLQTAGEWGILPAMVWIFVWVGGFYRLARRNDTGCGELALLLMLAGLALHSLVHFPLQVPALQIWGAVLLGFAWSRKSRRRSGASREGEASQSPTKIQADSRVPAR